MTGNKTPPGEALTSNPQFECEPENEVHMLRAMLAWFEHHPNADVQAGGPELLQQYRRFLRCAIERRERAADETKDGQM